MPFYFFALNDDFLHSEQGEEFQNDAAAREYADTLAKELSRNRHGREQQCIAVRNERGELIHRAWTSSDDA